MPPIPTAHRPVITRTVVVAVSAARAGAGPHLEQNVTDPTGGERGPSADVLEGQGATDPCSGGEVAELEIDDSRGQGAERPGDPAVDLGPDPWGGAARLVGVRLMRAQPVRVHPAWTVRLAGSLAAHALRLAAADPARDQHPLHGPLQAAAHAFTSYNPHERMDAGLELRRAALRVPGPGGEQLAAVGLWLTTTTAAAVLAATGKLCRTVETELTKNAADREVYLGSLLPLAYYSACGRVLLASLRAARRSSMSGPIMLRERDVLQPVVQGCWASGTWRTRVSLAAYAGISRPTLNDWINKATTTAG